MLWIHLVKIHGLKQPLKSRASVLICLWLDHQGHHSCGANDYGYVGGVHCELAYEDIDSAHEL